MTRLFTLEISDNKDQIGARLETQAAIETEGVTPPNSGIVAFQEYLQLKAPAKVVVPFAKELGVAMAKMATAPRILRDFARIMSLVKAMALIRHYHRQIDSRGQIMATLEDYETIRELINEMYIDSSTGATSDVRKLVEAVIRLVNECAEGNRITNTTLAKDLGTGVKQVTRRAGRAIKAGWLANREQRKSYPADYIPGEPMPEIEGLPVLAGLTPVNSVVSAEFEANNQIVDRLTPITDDKTPPDTSTIDLGMTIDHALELWQQHGAPVIHLSQGINCLDLGKLLSQTDVSPEHIKAVKVWLQQNKGGDDLC